MAAALTESCSQTMQAKPFPKLRQCPDITQGTRGLKACRANISRLANIQPQQTRQNSQKIGGVTDRLNGATRPFAS